MQTTTQEVIEVAPVDVSSDNQPLVAIPEVKPEEHDKVATALGELDFKDRTSVISFGASAQEKLDDISNRMIEGVKNKDLGKASEPLNALVGAIRGFDMNELDPNVEQPWYKKIFGGTEPMVKFIQGYEDVRDQIDIAANNLEKQKSQLMSDIISLDKLYEANLDYFRGLELYIAAGEQKLKDLNEQTLPEYEAKAQGQDMMAIQELKELRGFILDLERRVHDLQLSRQVAMQSLPSIRLVQENDKSLVNKINSTLVNTVPLWRNQLAQAVTIFRSHSAAGTLKSATDLTNELLEKNAEGLREANSEVRKQMERGVYDIESIKKANQTLIETLNDSLKIADEGKKARASALIELEKAESELKEALLSVKAKSNELPAEATAGAETIAEIVTTPSVEQK